MLSVLLASVLAAAAPEVEVRTVDGRTVTGPLVEMTSEGVTVQAGDEAVSLKTSDLMELAPKQHGILSDLKAGVRVRLADGSLVAGLDYTVDDGEAKVITSRGTLEMPARNVLAVRLQSSSTLVDGEWSRLVSTPGAGDLLVVRKGDVINYHEGMLRDVTAGRVHFELDGDVLPVKRKKVYGLVYCHAAGRELAEPICWITDTTGSRWAVESLKSSDGSIEWTTPSGLTVVRAFADMLQIDFSGGKVVYLSDLKPETVQWTPFFGTMAELATRKDFFAPQQDRGLQPETLKLGEKEYSKGLSIHSRTKLVYRLPGRFRRFKAIVGIDDRVRPQGNVELTILGDDRPLLEATATGTDPPRQLDLDLSGVRRLVILVDFGANADVADHLDLCEARVVK